MAGCLPVWCTVTARLAARCASCTRTPLLSVPQRLHSRACTWKPRAVVACARVCSSSAAASGGESFSALGLADSVHSALQQLGFASPTRVQEVAAPPILEGRHVVIAAETGSGKTYAYLAPLVTRLLQLPQPLRCPAAAVLCPNSVLADQVAAAANAMTGDDGAPLLRAAALTADVSLYSATEAGIPIVVCTPARLLEEVFDYSSGSWRTHPCPSAAAALRAVVIDEADMLLTGGFERPLKQLIQLLDRAERASKQVAEEGSEQPPRETETDDSAARQFVFAAATVHSSGRCTPGEALRSGFPDAVWVEGPQLHRCLPQVAHNWHCVPDECTAEELAEQVQAALDTPPGQQQQRVIVFANTTQAVQQLAAALGSRMPGAVGSFCADMTLQDRRAVVDAFRSGAVPVLVATDAAARGLDVPAVSHVVQANFALSAVDFLHRVGRTARAGAPGQITSLFDSQSAALVSAVRSAVEQGHRVEDAFSRKRSFSKKLKKYGESRRGPVDEARAAAKRLGPPPPRAPRPTY